MSKSVPTYGQRWPTYAEQWDRMVVEPRASGLPTHAEVTSDAKRLLKSKDRYENAEKLTDVPWFMIAVLHERESGGRFDKQLGQGWALTSKSKWEPYTGPFDTWEASAFDALVNNGKHYDKIVDWRLEKIIFYSERYNGWGYYQYRDIPSPYVWGATNIQERGKYVADRQWSSTTWDRQTGTAALMKIMSELDPSIVFVRET